MKKNWEIIAKDNNHIYYQQQDAYSPYGEFPADGVKMSGEEIRIEMNAFYRYGRIMYPLFENEDISEKQRKWFFNIYMHYLTELELRKGITWQKLEQWAIRDDIIEGAYGEIVQRIFSRLNDEEKQHIMYGMNVQKKIGESVLLFAKTLVRLTGEGIVYKNTVNEKELFYYLDRKKSNEYADRIKIVEEIFLPMEYTLRVFWQNHFAVFGELQTTKLEEIELL